MTQSVESSELWSWYTLTPHVGQEIVAVIRHLDGGASGPTWVEGFGEVKDPVVLTRSELGGRFERRLPGIWDMVSLRGSPRGDLFAVLTRESVLGPQHIGGLLASAELVTGTLRIGSAAGAAVLGNALNAALNGATAPAAPAAAPPPAVVSAPARPPEPKPASPSSPGAPVPPSPPGPTLISAGGTAMPKRPAARDTSVEQYPEEGDWVTHFAFGRCTVLFSDGERLRLQQERDGRVREVALSMLKVQEPTMIEGHRHWDLARKN